MKKISLLLLCIMIGSLLVACGSDETYDAALAAKERGDYDTALELFESLGEYKDSAAQVEEINTLDRIPPAIPLEEEGGAGTNSNENTCAICGGEAAEFVEGDWLCAVCAKVITAAKDPGKNHGGGGYWCLGKGDTCKNKTKDAADLYCSSCDPDGDNIEG